MSSMTRTWSRHDASSRDGRAHNGSSGTVRRRRRSSRRDQRGTSASTQYAVLAPAMMLIIFGMIQAGIYLHARNVAGEAANAAADVARSYHADPVDARQTAHKVAAVGGLHDVQVAVSKHAHTVSVTLTGNAPVLLDLGMATVHASANAPLERVTEP